MKDTFESEAEYLKNVIEEIDSQLKSLNGDAKKIVGDIYESQDQLSEETERQIGGSLWDMTNFHALVELSSFAAMLTGKVNEYDSVADRIEILNILRSSAYFARVDFKFDDDEDGYESEKIYIGRNSLTEEPSGDIMVYDWRAPISSVFYRYGVGTAMYEAPMGTISGEITLKRQYEISGSVLSYYFDADIQILDEFLRKILSQNASMEMKTIVETIQADQDQIIRDISSEVMVVNGVAGSGKTSVALHRVAYLMYRGLTRSLRSENILILSPNKLFAKYISQVLPSLGERNVNMSIFDNLLEEILDDYEIEYRDEYYDRMIHSEDYLRLKQNLEFKNSLEFKKILEKYASKFKPNFKAIYYDNTVVFDKEALEAIFNTYKKTLTLDTRLSLLREEILTEIHKRRPAKLERIKAYVEEHTVRHEQERDAFVRLIMIREGSVLAREIDQALGYDVYDAYQSLLKDHEKLKSLSKGIQIPDQLQIQASQTSQIAYDDASAVCYLKDLLSGNDQYTNIKQVVIDEAQDYYPLQYALLANRFNYSKFTILGDTKQTIARQNEGFFEVLSTIFSSKKSLFVTLTKSFRCTKQILSFTEKFLEGTRAVESFNRDGDEPVIRPTESLDDCLASLSKDIDDCFAAGYNSIGIITKTNQESVHYYDALKEAYHITLATKNSTLNNIVSSSVYMAKGLEFDCVFVMDVDVDHYSGDDDKNLLYIACTRALHRLYLYHEAGKPSALLT